MAQSTTSDMAGADAAIPYPVISVENFGPIAKAKVELRPLTVFVGRSNTGKSYMAILAYVLHQMFGIRRHRLTGEAFPFQTPVVSLIYRNLWQHPDRTAISAAMTSLIQKQTEALEESDSATTFPVPEHIIPMLRDLLSSPSGLADLTAGHLIRYFGIGPDVRALRRAGSDRPMRITLAGTPGPMAGDAIERQFIISIGKRLREQYRSSTLEGLTFEIDSTEHFNEMMFDRLFRELSYREISHAEENTNSVLWEVLFGTMAATRTAIFGLRASSAYYLPAGRTGLMHAHPAVGSALFDQAADLPLTNITPTLPMLSGLLSDFMRYLIPANQIKASDDELAKVAEEFEQNVLAGRISRTPSPSNYPSFTYESESPELSIPLRNTSSMISELAPLILLLRERIEVGDTLVIEEPEGHLHPAAQTEIARILVKLVNKGVRVIVTTHSEWLLDQFANLVRMSTLSSREREGLNGADAALDPKHFGAWLFGPRKKGSGSTATELLIDSKFDGTLSDYSGVAEQIYNTWAEIGNRIADRTES